MADERDARDMTEEEFLASYHQSDYPRPSFTADVAVFSRGHSGDDMKLLLVKRGGHPYRGCWALPGGFVNAEEDANAAGLRELREETGIVDAPCEQLGVYSKPGRDPRGWTATSAYVALLDEPPEACAGDDAARAVWCPVRVTDEGHGRRVLDVEADGEKLTCFFETEESRLRSSRARVTESTGFAFDHAQIVADAFLVIEGFLKEEQEQLHEDGHLPH